MDGNASSMNPEKSAEEALSFQASILKIMDDALIAFDPCQHITYWSPGAQKMYGWTAEEALGKSPSEILRPLQYETETLQDKKEKQAAFARGDLVQGESLQRRKDGSEFWVEYHAQAIFDGKGTLSGFVSMQQDITRRKRAEEALLESGKLHAFHSAILESVRDPVWVSDSDLLIEYWNDAAAAVFGWTAEEAMGKHTGELFRTLVPGTTREEAVEKARRTGDFFGEYMVHCKDGHPIIIEARCHAVRGPGGEVVRFVNTVRDITERKQAEEAKERLTALMDNNPSLVFLKDEEGRYVYLNKAYEMNFIPSGDWYGKTDFDFWPKESAELFRTNDASVLNSGQTMQYIEDSADLKGNRYCWLNYKFPFIDSKNRKYLGGIGINATRLIQAEEALQRTAEELRNKERETLELIDGFTEGSWIVDRLEGMIICSEKWARRLGLDRVPEKDRLAYTHTLSHPDDTKNGNSIESCMNAGMTRFDLEYRVKTVDSGYIWTQNRGKIVYDTQGKAVKVYAATIDITERRRAEEALRESEERFRTVQDNSLDRFSILKPIYNDSGDITDFIYVYHNAQASRIVGRRPDEMIGKRVSEVFPTFSKTRFFTIYKQVIETGQALDIEDRYNFDGVDEWFRATLTPVPDGIAVAAQSITERKRAEEALRASEAQARLLAGELDKKNRLVTDFFINISHEFKTPLTILMMGLDLLETKARKVDAGKAFLGNLTAMKQNSYRLNRLVGNLLDITKLDAGFMQPKWEVVDVSTLLRNLAKSVETYAKQKKLTLEYKCASGSIPFTTDSFMLERIVLNLLSNAIKHTPSGGRIILAFSAKGDEITIAVADTGEGIPENKKAVIFDRFSQVDTKMTRANEGTGIGLALTKSLVELLGGKISVKSEPGKGSTFMVELPVIQMELTKGKIEQGGMQIEKRVQIELSDVIST